MPTGMPSSQGHCLGKVAAAVAACGLAGLGLLLTARSAASGTGAAVTPEGATRLMSRRFAFAYRASFEAPPAATKRLRVWFPLPRNDAHQDVTRLDLRSPLPYAVHEEPRFKNRMAVIDVEGDALRAPWKLELSVDVARREHLTGVFRGNGRKGLDEAEAKALEAFLAPDRLVPLDDAVRRLAADVVGNEPYPINKIRRAYDHVLARMQYRKDGTGWGRGDVSWCLKNNYGNCTDFHSLFIALCRASGVPAKFAIGFPIPHGKREGAIGGYHCWAEAYLPGFGFMPVDISEAWKNPEMREYYFGAHSEDRVEFTVGRDLVLEPAQAGDPLNYFIYPYAEADGAPFDKVACEFSFRDLE